MTAAPIFNTSAQISQEQQEKLRRKAESKAYLDGLEYSHITKPNDPDFPEAYDLFSQIFKIDDKPMVSVPCFHQLFAFNDDDSLQEKWGPLSYCMTFARDPADDKIIGGTVYVAMIPHKPIRDEGKVDVLYMGGYLFVDPEKRGCGLALRLVEEREKSVKDYARKCLAEQGEDRENPRLLAFNEQNDPRKMTLSEFLDDIRVSKIHPCDRITSSRDQAGWKAIDLRFNYIEPDRDGDPGADYLVLNVKGEGKTPAPPTIPSSVLSYFLLYYAALRKDGGDPKKDQICMRQQFEVQRLGTLVPGDDSEELKQLKPVIDRIVAAADPARDANVRISDLLFRDKIRSVVANDMDEQPLPAFALYG